MVFAETINAKVSRQTSQIAIATNSRSATGDYMDKYDVIGLAIAIIAVSIVLLH
jgi:hypothetical protein